MIDPRPNTQKQNIRGWIVVFSAAIFYMYQFMIRVSPNVMKDEIMSLRRSFKKKMLLLFCTQITM